MQKAPGFCQLRLPTLSDTGKLPPCVARWEKIIQQDAAPLHAIDRQQYLHARALLWRDGVHKLLKILPCHRHRRLTEEVADQLRRIVPTGILEINESQSTARR